MWLVLLCVIIRCDYCGYLIDCVCGYCLAWFVGLLCDLLCLEDSLCAGIVFVGVCGFAFDCFVCVFY